MEEISINCRVYATVEEAVPAIERTYLLYGPAGSHAGWRKLGELWVARYRLPEYQFSWSFSFVVSKDSNHWYCSECRVGSNALDLYTLIEGYGDKSKALVDVACERWVQL